MWIDIKYKYIQIYQSIVLKIILCPNDNQDMTTFEVTYDKCRHFPTSIKGRNFENTLRTVAGKQTKGTGQADALWLSSVFNQQIKSKFNFSGLKQITNLLEDSKI